MTDRAIPHASAVTNAVVDALRAHGEDELSLQIASVHRAMCDFVHAMHAAHEAPTHSLRVDAQRKASASLALLRAGEADGVYLDA